MMHAAVALKVFVIGWLLYSTISRDLERRAQMMQPSWLAGLYRVESVSRNGQQVPLLLSDAKLWGRWEWIPTAASR